MRFSIGPLLQFSTAAESHNPGFELGIDPTGLVNKMKGCNKHCLPGISSGLDLTLAGCGTMAVSVGHVQPLTCFEFILQPELLKAHIKQGAVAPGPKELLNAFLDQALSCCKAMVIASSRHAHCSDFGAVSAKHCLVSTLFTGMFV